MAITNLFGELEYTEQELKEMKKKEAEEKAKQEAEAKAKEEAKKAAAELKKQIKDKKKEILSKFEELIANADDNESLSGIEEAKNLIDTIDTPLELDNLWNPFDTAYNAMKAVAKQKEKEAKQKEVEEKAKKYKYPFLMYFGHEYRDVTGVFEEGKEYSDKQLAKILIEHGYKDFKYAQEIEWEYFEDENCLYPKFKLGNRG